VRVKSPGEILFYGKPDRRYAGEKNCISSIVVYLVPHDRDFSKKREVWNAYNSSGICADFIEFPNIPKNFVGEYTRTRLDKGHYQAQARIWVWDAEAEFDIE